MSDNSVNREDIIELIDEDGNILEFEYLLTYRVESECFIAFTPIKDMEDYSVGEVLIMRVGEDEDGEEVFLPIDSQEELDELWAIFQEIYFEDEEDVEEEDKE